MQGRVLVLVVLKLLCSLIAATPLRIHSHYDASIESLEPEYKSYIKDTLLKAATQWIQDNIQTTQSMGDTGGLIERKCRFDRIMYRDGSRICMMGCDVTKCGSVTVPEEHLQGCRMFKSTVPDGLGVSGAEFILYVSATDQCQPDDQVNDIVVGQHCGDGIMEKRAVRPMYGYLTFCTKKLDTRVSKYEESVYKVLQKLFNILVLDKGLLKRFVKSDDEFRTYKESVETASGQTIVKDTSYLKTPAVLAFVKGHFGCGVVPGAQLEPDTGDAILFEKRIFNGEVMTANINKRAVVSELTRAVFHDSGWYSVNKAATQTLVWGKDMGCPFLRNSCYQYLNSKNYLSDRVAPFCVDQGRMQCTADHRARGQCLIRNYDYLLPMYQNFKSMTTLGPRSGGHDKYADFCPYYSSQQLCSDPTNQPALNLYGQEFQALSRCFNFVSDFETPIKQFKQDSSGCYPVTCNGDGTYDVRVQKTTYTCSSGGTVEVTAKISNVVNRGNLTCPPYDIICASDEVCSRDCNGNGRCVVVEGEEECACYPGYHGDNCRATFNVNYCKEKPCQNNEECTNADGYFMCACKSNRMGLFCHLDSICQESSCSNGGTCSEVNGAIACQCKPGFTGEKCEEEDEVCEENRCQNNGKCYTDTSLEEGFYCVCSSNYEGALCESEVCTESSCNRRGTCSSVGSAVKCACDPGYSGYRCEQDDNGSPSCLQDDHCYRDPSTGEIACVEGRSGPNCEIGDICVLDMPCNSDNTLYCESSTRLRFGFRCVCKDTFTGIYCDDSISDLLTPSLSSTTTLSSPKTTPPLATLPVPNDCDPNPCRNQGICLPTLDDQLFICKCQEGWKGVKCEVPVVTCQMLNCGSGTCRQDTDNATCQCKAGWSGTRCDKYTGNCLEGLSPCLHDATCIDLPDNKFKCECTDSYEGELCEKEKDPCEDKECENGGKCISVETIAVCECPIGYGGNSCEQKVDHCFAEPCENGGVCQYHADNHTFNCQCAPLYTGVTCSEERENSCEIENLCKYDTPCNGTLDDYTCLCPDGLEGQYCEININDCAGNPCQVILFSICKDLIGGFECQCMPGFESKENRCMDINECTDPSNCINGFCLNLPGKYSCMCAAGWKGEKCDVNLDECENHKCANGATCIDKIADYECECINGYSGRMCELPPLPCDKKPCEQENAVCINLGETDFKCTCPNGFEGKRCEIDIDECKDLECGEHGVCRDGIGIATCLCEVGYGGSSCSIYTGSCLEGLSPCLNNATCIDLPDNKFKCECTDFYEGEFCEANIDDCKSNPCKNGGLCEDGLGSYACTCTDGWEGKNCTDDIDECDENPCRNGATCNNTRGGYECLCKEGYDGFLCGNNIDDCVNHKCLNDAKCVDDVGNYTCQCLKGYTGDRCEVKIEGCKPDSCLNNGICSLKDNTVTCNCSGTGYYGKRCETDVNECENVICEHGGVCRNLFKSFKCECPCSFEGILCEVEVDFCRESKCNVEHSLTCMPVPNACNYSCICEDGWQGQNCNVPRDECQDSPCVHGTCNDHQDGYNCTCETGYGGIHCDEDLDMCRGSPCFNGATCETVIIGPSERAFRCNCTQYYEGTTCQDRKPPCSISPCGDNGFCFTKENEELCYCNEGFTGPYCEIDVDECEDNPCKNGGVCEDEIANYNCICEPGYAGKNCTMKRDPCLQHSNLCENGGTCSECQGEDCQHRYICSCMDGFTGHNCSINIDDCANRPCRNGAACADKVNGYECVCADGYDGDQCEIDINECDPNPCWYQSNCTDLVGDYQCQCEGSLGKNCEIDVDECKDGSYDCQNGGECINIPRSYECKCRPGFGGDHCEREILPCDTKPCLNMGDCIEMGSTYLCQCQKGYSGAHCEVPGPVCRNYNCNGGTCLEVEGKPTCKCDITHTGDACNIELCTADKCKNDGVCMNTPEGARCLCNLPFVGDVCQNRVKVLKLTPTAKGIVLVGSQDETSLKLNMGLKVLDAVSEQIILSQDTVRGRMELKIVDGLIQLLLPDDHLLSVPITDETVQINVILEENYAQLKAGNETSVHVYDTEVNPAYGGEILLGKTNLVRKRSTVSSFTGCIIGLVKDVSIVEGRGFAECEDSYEECENGGVRVGSVCQCRDGFAGDICQIEVKNSCKRISCPGKCRETSFGPECICDWPTYGEMCSKKIAVPSFRADSSVEFPIDVTDNATLLFEFKPYFPKGFISIVTGIKRSRFIAIYLDEGYLHIARKLDDKAPLVVKHTLKAQIEQWNMVQLVLTNESLYIALNGDSIFTNSTDIFDVNRVMFGNKPVEIEVDGMENLPGFFGEILPLDLNGKPNWNESKGTNVVAYSNKTSGNCSSKPCGKDNHCYDTTNSFYCLCRYSSGPSCGEPISQITFLGTGYALFNQKHNAINILDLTFRVKPILNGRESILLSGFSQPSTEFVITVGPEGFLTVTVMDTRNETKYVMKSQQAISFVHWSSISFMLAPQKMSIGISPGVLPTTTRLKFDYKLFNEIRPKIVFGGVKGKLTAVDNIGGFLGQLSLLELNRKSILNSITMVEKSITSGNRSPCAQFVCGRGGVCVEDGGEEFHCECISDVQHGVFCNETVDFEVISVAEGGFVSYAKSFQQGDELNIRFSLNSFTSSSTLLSIGSMFTNKGKDLDVSLFPEGYFNWGERRLPIELNQVLELSMKRKQNYIELRYQDEVFENPISSENRLEKVITMSFAGQLFVVKMNDVVLKPSDGHKLAEGSYPLCYNNPCVNGGVCVDVEPDNFTCTCPNGFTGRYCNSLVDMCADVNCNETSECISVNGLSFYCKPCPEGYKGSSCEEKAFCELLKPCAYKDIVGNCTETKEAYTCDCGDGKERTDCDTTKSCDDVECQNDGVCVEEDDRAYCNCPDIFTGKLCENVLDNCQPLNPCLNGGECISEPSVGDYFCLCPQEFKGKHCEERKDPCLRNPCFNNGTCHSNDSDGSYECKCADGFYGDNCKSSNCDNNLCYRGDCVPNAKNYTCACLDGLKGTFCDDDVDECENADICTQQGVCSNSFGSYECKCYTGFEGKNCETNIPDCRSDSCNGHGLCIDGYNNYSCLCDPLFSGENCEIPLDMCDPNPCGNGARCYNYGVDYFCVCAGGYEGRNCTMDTDDCKYNWCEHGSTCVDQLGGYKCNCVDGYRGRFCEDDINECEDNPCKNSGKCVNTEGSFLCQCPKYYDGPRCETVLSECYDDPCKNGGSCKELGSAGEGRICLCPEGWKGVNCTVRVYECESSRCLNGGDCIVESTGNQCVCKYPHFGTFCDGKITIPSFLMPDSYLSVVGNSVDLQKGIEFRILPSSPGVVLSLSFYEQVKSVTLLIDASGSLFVRTLYEEADLPFATLMGKLVFDKWTQVYLKIDENTLLLRIKSNRTILSSESFSLDMAGATLRQIRFGNPEENSDEDVSFRGAIYDFLGELRSTTDSKNVGQSNNSDLCNHGNGGKCGEMGTCFDGNCLCPLQRTGNACEQHLAFPSPMFPTGKGYVCTDNVNTQSWELELSVHGVGNFLYGMGYNDIVFRGNIGEDYIKFKGRDVEELVRWKGARLWTNLEISSDGYRITISIHGGEMLEIIIKNPIVRLCIGGMEGEGYFKGTIAKIILDGKEPKITESANAFESNMDPCDTDACMNSHLKNRVARCVSDHMKPHEYQCICPTGFTGKYCQNQWGNQTPKFNRNSYIKFRGTPQNFGKELSLKLVLKVTEKTVDTRYIFSTSSLPGVPDFLHVYIKRSKIHAAFDLGDDIAIAKAHQKVDDGQWHFVHLTLRGRHLMLMVDRRVSEAIAPGPSSVLNVDQYFYLGPPETKLQSFVGCIESATINSSILTMMDSVETVDIDFCGDAVPETSIYNFKYRL